MARRRDSFCGLVAAAMAAAMPSSASAEDAARPALAWSVTVGGMTDYVYRGVSLNDERPTPAVALDIAWGRFYLSTLLIGTDLGVDAAGRDIANVEADATLGYLHTIGDVELNIGVKYTGYPDGRDVIAGTRIEAERDFIEPFAGATVKMTDAASLGATVYWTPDFYNETGRVTTLEARAGYLLPPIAALNTRLVGAVGFVKSQRRDVVAPGDDYLYWNAGIEGQLDRIVFDLKYWNTDVDLLDGFEQRIAFSLGFKLSP